MKIKKDFPREIIEIENTWITLSDGCKLAARIWLPLDADQDRVPAILEYIPYRKNDLTAMRDSLRMPYFAGHGYAAVRVDMRGSGDSDGLLLDEYLPQEQQDGLEVLSWIASQPWCSGRVGIIGISWGGFNGLQIAAHRPPELCAVISLCSTDDRYSDDVHYMGGCIIGSDMLSWASIMLGLNCLPPDPQYVGDRWREIWMDRLNNTPPYINEWLAHQRRDAYWKQGSVCQDYGSIECPVYVIGGWADGYSNAVPRLMEGLKSPHKGLIGPWAHSYPNDAFPGPPIGFLQECLRWWDYWLKGLDTGIMNEPMLRVWMQESVPPQAGYETRPGRWVAEPTWPSLDREPTTYWFHGCELRESASEQASLQIPASEASGLYSGIWCPYGEMGDFPTDQRPEDALALSFTSAPLDSAVEILGFPEVTLSVSVNRRDALLAVRLCDVAPTGASTLVTRGFLNLTHRDSHELPTHLTPGSRYSVKVQMHAIAHAFPAGNRVRVAISPAYWPQVWPSPEPVTLELFTGKESFLHLPVRLPQPEDESLAEFDEPESSSPLDIVQLRPHSRKREILHNIITQELQVIDVVDDGIVRLLANGIEIEGNAKDAFRIIQGQPLSASVQCERLYGIARGDWQTRVETISTMSADSENFLITNQVQAFESAIRIFTKTWHFSVKRDHV